MIDAIRRQAMGAGVVVISPGVDEPGRAARRPAMRVMIDTGDPGIPPALPA